RCVPARAPLYALSLHDALPIYLAELLVLVGVAVVEPGRLELLVDPVEARGDRRSEGQVRIGVGARNAVLHAEARPFPAQAEAARSEEHTSELQSRVDLVCRLLL